MKKTLFNENENYTREAVKIISEAESILKPFLNNKRKQGYSVRELEYLLHQAVTDMTLDIYIDII